jgi:hypothetical protein
MNEAYPCILAISSVSTNNSVVSDSRLIDSTCHPQEQRAAFYQHSYEEYFPICRVVDRTAICNLIRGHEGSLGGVAMFTVRWVSREKINKPIVSDESAFTSLDATVVSAQERLYSMRLRYIHSPPDGFIVVDDDGKELRRWLAPRTHAL